MTKKKGIALYSAAFVIPCGIYLITLLILGAAPFGSGSLVISDAKNQYIDFLSYWRTVLLGENDLFYTFSKTLGGDMLNLAAYYLLSPVNVLFLLADVTTLPVVYTAVMVLKIALCGLFFFHTSVRLYGLKASHLIFSSCYALMAYTTLYGWNIMWMDGVMVLPLLMLGLYRLMEGKAPWLYMGCLAYSLAANFYIGYMLCIASVLCFLALVLLKPVSPKVLLRRTGTFALGSLLGGLGAALVWLPAFLSIAGERSQTGGFTVSLAKNPYFLNLPGKFLCASASVAEVAGGVPHVFCGTLVLLLAAGFFLNRKNPIRQKIAAAGVLLVFLISFVYATPNTVWHGFSPANSFNYRYSFLFSFALIVIAQYQFSRRKELSGFAVAGAAGLAACVFLVAFVQRAEYLQLTGGAVSFAALALCALCLLKWKKQGAFGLALLFLICLAELGTNCLLSWKVVTDEEWTLDIAQYRQEVTDIRAAVDYVAELDDGFYRMEKTFYRGNNDSALFGYNGLSHFSSTEPVFVKPFMRSMGYSTHYNFWAGYTKGSTAEADALLGVKYLLTREETAKTSGYIPEATVNGIHIYRNPHALPLAVLVNSGVTAVPSDTLDAVSLHNAIWSAATGDSSPVLLPQEYECTPVNLAAQSNADGTLTYTRIDPEQDACLRYTLTLSQALPLYFHISGQTRDTAQVYVNGSLHGLYFDDFSWNMDCVGTFSPGETVIIELHPVGQQLNVGMESFFCEDTESLARLSRQLLQQPVELNRQSSSRLSGSFSARQDQLLMFTVPYSGSWQLRIDGEPVPAQMVLGCFLAASVPEGNHSFTMTYTPAGFSAGAALSACALICTLAWFLLRKKAARP